MGRDVSSLMLSIQHFLCWPRCCPPSKVPWRMVLERLSWRVTCPNHTISCWKNTVTQIYIIHSSLTCLCLFPLPQAIMCKHGSSATNLFSFFFFFHFCSVPQIFFHLSSKEWQVQLLTSLDIKCVHQLHVRLESRREIHVVRGKWSHLHQACDRRSRSGCFHGH